jgi:hypothetical protein
MDEAGGGDRERPPLYEPVQRRLALRAQLVLPSTAKSEVLELRVGAPCGAYLRTRETACHHQHRIGQLQSVCGPVSA